MSTAKLNNCTAQLKAKKFGGLKRSNGMAACPKNIFVFVSVYLSDCFMSVCIFFQLSIGLFVWLFVFKCVCLFVSLSFVYLFDCLFFVFFFSSLFLCVVLFQLFVCKYWSNYWHTLISKDTSGFTSNTLLIRIQYLHTCN